jgi:hypothetical protein
MSGSLTSLGKTSKTVFLATEEEKITHELVASAAIKAGQPIKLTATGTAAVWVNTDGVKALVGYAVTDAASGEYVTIWTRGFAIIYALSNAAQNAGPVEYTSYDTTTEIGDNTGYSKYAASSDATKINGWALDDAADAGELIRVLMMD